MDLSMCHKNEVFNCIVIAGFNGPFDVRRTDCSKRQDVPATIARCREDDFVRLMHAH